MAVIANALRQRWLSSSVLRPSRVTIILLVMILIGAAIAIWARWRIDSLLQVDDGAELTFQIGEIDGDCGTPAVYVDPEPTGKTSRYRLLIDFLGGPNRFPMLGGGDTVPVLTLPASRPPGVGLGRGLPENCRAVSLSIAGNFRDHGVENGFAGVDTPLADDVPYMTMESDGTGAIEIAYRKPAMPTAVAALAAITLEGVPDRWQEGSKRVALVNEGNRDLNVFVHEERGFQFVNEADALVRPIGLRRGYVDAHLGGPDGAADNAVVVYRRRPTAEIELQHALIGISTIFGIGVSLLVEGVIVLVISFASARRPGADAPYGAIETNSTSIEESREVS